jgi:hypothetical protein
MLRKTWLIGCSVVLGTLMAAPAWAGNGAGPGAGSGACISSLPYEEVSEAEAAGLRYMREEEKLARDVYTAMNQLWAHWVFAHIVESEQRHMDRVGQLLEKYQLADPVVDDAPGVFTDAGLQALYGQLVAAGKVSLVAAFHVGATIEDLDIHDLGAALNLADNEDIRTVYQNLRKASRNHLRAFVYQLSLQGQTYAPQYLSLEEFQAIIDSAPERGPVDENGDPVDVGGGSRWESGTPGQGAGGDCLLGGELLSRRARHGGNGGGGYGPGDGTGNGGNGPKDGTGNGRKAGKCVNNAHEGVEMAWT